MSKVACFRNFYERITREKNELLCGSANEANPMVTAQAEKKVSLFDGDFRNRLKVIADITEPNIPKIFPIVKRKNIETGYF